MLDTASEYFSRINGCSGLLPEVDKLRSKLFLPCVLAVGGKVKAGKSSFINALLGKQLAKVGELETTATINMFRHIDEASAGYSDEKPVKVVWNSGMETWESASFMDSLQGNDDATLKRAEGIAYLVFYVDNPILKELTLVDTPGTDAVVGEHQEVAERFFRLRKQHDTQTNEQMAEADAVIYLVGAVAGASAKQFLSDFQKTTTGASALNALGVLSKVDIDETLLARRQEQAEYVAESLKEELYTVIPVSAGMHDAVLENEERFPQLQQWLKAMPEKAFEYFMRSDKDYLTDQQAYLDAIYRGSTTTAPPVDERRKMKGEVQWALFRSIARALYKADSVKTAKEQLLSIANINTVRQIIDERFFRRSKIIRCSRILKDLHTMALRVKRSSLIELDNNRADHDVWMSIIAAGESQATKEAADALRRFISMQLPSKEEIKQLEDDLRQRLIIPIENLLQEIVDIDAGFQYLSILQSRRSVWPEEEYHELCYLFGMYGDFEFPEGFDMADRQAHWQYKASRLRDHRDQTIAEYAVECYGRRIQT